MSNYANYDSVMNILLAQANMFESNNELIKWLKTGKVKETVYAELLEEELGNEDELLSTKLNQLDALLASLEKFEDDHKEIQLKKFSILETERRSADLYLQIEGTLTGRISAQTKKLTETRKCKHNQCGNMFLVDSNSQKQYCSTKCRENAKKWRQRNV